MLTDVSSRQTVVQYLGESGHEASQEKPKAVKDKEKILENHATSLLKNNIITIQSHEGSKGNKVQTILNA